ncbi:phage baseplate assembly protein [Xanthobacter autotrophicus]|uniref:phage baseplate assembly protein domain-containing protein n=1 Tax=Xanthobacter TaxID=279 RepID=UPI0024AB08C4|nr:phage baseplate assembly protein [Xanthobacter autotrophicus]MDI4664721.1 phage baseplate assembly protein [Xanthobacter autotrophicus]
MPDRETAHLIRGLVTRGRVTASNDNSEAQTVNVTQWKDVEHADVEVLQTFGLASRAPRNGLVVLFAVGGDQGDLVALPVGQPGVRLGNLDEGEAALYCIDGSRVHIKADGTVEIVTSNKVVCKKDGHTLELTDGYVRGRMDDGSRFTAWAGGAKLSSGGHFLAVTSAGITVSVPPVVGAEPSPDI